LALIALLAFGMFTVWATSALAGTAAEMTHASSLARIDGVASYREPIALPPGAVFEGTLEDVSRADAPSILIGKTVVDNPQPPIRFAISFDPADISPERTYAVRARILVDGRLWFTSDRIHRVLTRGAGNAVEIPLKRVPSAQPRPPLEDRDSSAVLPAQGLRLPATFRGDLPCADCAGVRHHLDLWPDQVFHLRREWLRKGMVRGDIGRWRVDPGRRALVLHGGAEMPLQYEILGPDRLRQLDFPGKPIVSELPYELQSDGVLDPTDVSLFMGGEMTYQADVPRFTECLTGRSYPIASGSEALRLQRAYLADIRQPGAALYVTFEGTITHRPGITGERPEPVVTVQRFIATWPEQACARAKAAAPLVNTYWRIVRLQGSALHAVTGRREPHLVLRQSDEHSNYTATIGCNTLMGTFEIAADRLSFSLPAATKVGCPVPLAEMERRLGEVLDDARRWQILGNTLLLKDEAGDDLALLEAPRAARAQACDAGASAWD
jgi:uncharacterized lipoprotein YbaY/heat shock protein HslJ/uncharacterized lipoprotein NlpE involved in copper resistance